MRRKTWYKLSNALNNPSPLPTLSKGVNSFAFLAGTLLEQTIFNTLALEVVGIVANSIFLSLHFSFTPTPSL